MGQRLISCSDTSLDIMAETMSDNGATFAIEKRGYFRSLWQGRHKIATSQAKFGYHKYLSNNKATSLLGAVKKSVNKYIIEKNFDIPRLEWKYRAYQLYRDRYYRLAPGATLYYVDIKHCYWRIAYKMGIISQYLYDYYKDYKPYKLARNIALSVLATGKERTYYNYGSSPPYTIKCESEIYQVIYRNIRYTAYNMMGAIDEIIGDSSLGYHIDGIYVLPEGLDEVRRQLKIKKFLYRVNKCEKIDDKTLYENGEKKRFV